jgi:hypothetical protein
VVRMMRASGNAGLEMYLCAQSECHLLYEAGESSLHCLRCAIQGGTGV